MKNDIISIFFVLLSIVINIILSIVDNKSKRKIWTVLLMFFLIASLIPSVLSLVEKKKQEKVDLLNKYKNQLNDDDILQQLHELALGSNFIWGKVSPTKSTFKQDVIIRFIKIYSPMGLIAKYKVIDPSEYGLQNITPLAPITYNDSVFYIGFVSVSKKDYSKRNKVTVITKYNNGLIELEQILIEEYIFSLKKLHLFAPLLLTNRERLLIVQEAGRSAKFPPVTRFDEYFGIIDFGWFGNPEHSPSGRVKLLNNGGIEVELDSISNEAAQEFYKLVEKDLNEDPKIVIDKMQNQQPDTN